MGIEKFYFAIRNKLNDDIIPLTDVLNKATLLYIDFNSFVHKASERVVSQLNVELMANLYNERIKAFDLELLPQATQWRESVDQIGYDQNLKKRIIKEIIRSVDAKISVASNAKIIYLALDGIPEMSKVMEQKNRRSIGFTITKVEESIDERYNNSDILNHYNKLKFKFDRSEISAYTNFMDDIVNELKQKYKNNEKVKISGVSEYAEGEKKIMQELLTLDSITKDDVILILSPDADVILLAGIALCHIRKKFFVNPDVFVYNKEIVNIKTLENYINNEVKDLNDKMKKVSNIGKLIADSVIFQDFIFLCTFFGNDFLPRILSFSEVYDNIDILLVVYSKTLSGGGLLKYDGKYTVNFARLKEIIKELVYVDSDNTGYKIYIQNKVKNSQRKLDRGHLEELLDSLQKHGYEKTMYYNYIEMKHRDNKKLFTITLYDSAKYLCENAFHYFSFSKMQTQLEYTNPGELLEIVEKNKKDIPGIMAKYISDNFTEYDFELIAFRSKKSAWKVILNDVDYTSSMEQPKENIIKNYVDGLVWVTDWYFNRIMMGGSVSLWYYQGHTTPFLSHILKYLEKASFDDASMFLDVDKYFTKNEYMQYVSVSEQDKEKIVDYVRYVMKVLNVAKIKYTDDGLSQVREGLKRAGYDGRVFIDCKHARFLGKCHVDIKYMDFHTFIKSVRQKGGIVYKNK